MSARDAVTRHCGYNSCAGDVTCECVCVGCIVACRRFADAVLRKATEAEASRPTPTTWPPARDPAADLARALEHLEAVKNEEVEKARREGRDAGLREVREALRQEAVNPADADDYEGLMAGVVLIDGLLRTSPSPAPDIASLQSDLAKLRAVAEAAARLQRWRHSDQVSYAEGEQSDDALMATLDAALPNWRSAP